MESLTLFLLLFCISSVLGVLILIQRSSSETEDKSTNVKTTSSFGIGLLTIAIVVLIVSRIVSISNYEKVETGYKITFAKKSIMFLSSFVLVFCSALLGVTSVFGRHLMHDTNYIISLSLLGVSVITAGWFSSRQDTFGIEGMILLFLTSALVFVSGFMLNKVSASEDPDMGSELKKSFSDLPKVAWSIGGFAIGVIIIYGLYRLFKDESSPAKGDESPAQAQGDDRPADQ